MVLILHCSLATSIPPYLLVLVMDPPWKGKGGSVVGVDTGIEGRVLLL